MKNVPEPLARQMLAEYKDIRKTRFWEYLLDCYEDERIRAKNEWENTETGTLASPLMDKWLRLQGQAKAWKKAQTLHLAKIQELENIIGKE
jgi:hypothetical protein